MRTKHRPHIAHPGKFSQRLGDRRLLAYVGLTAAILITYAVFHFRAGYSFPLPWPDEAHFLWQANGFAEHFSLFAPELNPSRTILWMPPGYFLVVGIVIKIFGLSLMVARHFSFVLMLVAISLVAALVRRYYVPILSLALAIPFVLGPPFVACGNVARMEALLIVALLSGFLLIQREKRIEGLCVLALSPLIHPNGVYFFVSGVIAAAVLWPRPWRLRKPTTSESILIVVVLAAWTGYAIYAALHWADFVHDMTFQFARKVGRDIKPVLLSPFAFAMIGLMLVAAAYCYKKRLKAALLLAIIVPSWWVAAYGIEMWYRVFFALSFYLLAVVFVNIGYSIVRTEHRRTRRLIEPVVLGCVVVGVIGWNVIVASFGESLAYPDPRPWYGMTMGNKSYMDRPDITALRAILNSIPQKGHVPVVEFYPAAEALLFTSPKADIQYSCPLFCETEPDWYLVHMSTSFTPTLDNLAQELLAKLKVDPHDLAKSIVHLRDSTGQWFLIPSHANR